MGWPGLAQPAAKEMAAAAMRLHHFLNISNVWTFADDVRFYSIIPSGNVKNPSKYGTTSLIFIALIISHGLSP